MPGCWSIVSIPGASRLAWYRAASRGVEWAFGGPFNTEDGSERQAAPSQSLWQDCKHVERRAPREAAALELRAGKLFLLSRERGGAVKTGAGGQRHLLGVKCCKEGQPGPSPPTPRPHDRTALHVLTLQ